MTKKSGFHEDFKRDDGVKPGSDQAFGLIFAAGFAIFGFLPFLTEESLAGFSFWPLAFSTLLLSITFMAPELLRPFNLLWFKFGLLLHKVISPLVMGLLFYLVITPIAWVMRLFGKRPLNLRFDKNADSYWIKRDPPGPEPKSMKNQF